jgi:hypothetical protein
MQANLGPFIITGLLSFIRWCGLTIVIPVLEELISYVATPFVNCYFLVFFTPEKM